MHLLFLNTIMEVYVPEAFIQWKAVKGEWHLKHIQGWEEECQSFLKQQVPQFLISPLQLLLGFLLNTTFKYHLKLCHFSHTVCFISVHCSLELLKNSLS